MQRQRAAGLMLGLAALAVAGGTESASVEPERKRPTQKIRWIRLAKGLPPMAGAGRGPIKRNKSRRWHAKRLAKKGK